VDDEIDITFSLKILLEENGFKVYTFNKPSSVLRDFRADLYDLIILDIKMPEINGFNLYKKIREIDNKVNVEKNIPRKKTLKKKRHFSSIDVNQ
jgi:DNA-binding response OmpR family regulator